MHVQREAHGKKHGSQPLVAAVRYEQAAQHQRRVGQGQALGVVAGSQNGQVVARKAQCHRAHHRNKRPHAQRHQQNVAAEQRQKQVGYHGGQAQRHRLLQIPRPVARKVQANQVRGHAREHGISPQGLFAHGFGVLLRLVRAPLKLGNVVLSQGFAIEHDGREIRTGQYHKKQHRQHVRQSPLPPRRGRNRRSRSNSSHQGNFGENENVPEGTVEPPVAANVLASIPKPQGHSNLPEIGPALLYFLKINILPTLKVVWLLALFCHGRHIVHPYFAGLGIRAAIGPCLGWHCKAPVAHLLAHKAA